MGKNETYIVRSETDTLKLGEKIAARWTPPVTVLLRGDLGAGKTVLTRGFSSGIGLEDLSLVHSPTFSLINIYETPRGNIYHVDLYRLESRKEQYSIGLDEILGETGFVIIEWAEKLQIPIDEYLSVEIRILDQDTREITIENRTA